MPKGKKFTIELTPLELSHIQGALYVRLETACRDSAKLEFEYPAQYIPALKRRGEKVLQLDELWRRMCLVTKLTEPKKKKVKKNA